MVKWRHKIASWINFQLLTHKVSKRDEFKCDKVFSKVYWLRNYWAVNLEYVPILLLFLETLPIFSHFFTNKWSFKFSLTCKFTSEYCFKIAYFWFQKSKINVCSQFDVIVFPPETENSKKYDFRNTKIYFPAKCLLKRIKKFQN